MKAKIIGFTKFLDGQDNDCIAITDKGVEIIVDPFVGCSWEYDKREYLLNQWFEDKNAWIHKDIDGRETWLTNEHSFHLLPSN